MKIVSDRRGSADLVQFILIMPIVILLLYGSFEVWKVISVKQSLSAATYQASRCLSEAEQLGLRVSECDYLLRNELLNNPLLDEGDVATVDVRYYRVGGSAPSTDPADLGLGCWDRFRVEAELFLPWPVLIPGLPDRNPTVTARHTNYVECGPRWRPTPTPTP